MKRKIIELGNNCMVLSLPIKWVRNNELGKGDEIDVEEEPTGVLSIKSKKSKRSIINKVSIDADGMDRFDLSRTIRGLYHSRVDEITLNFTKNKIMWIRENKEVDLVKGSEALCKALIGLVMTKKTKNQIVLQCFISKEDNEKIDNVERRVFLLIKEFMNDILANIDNFKEFHKTIWERHDNIAQFCDYYLRVIAYSDKHIEVKTSRYVLISLMDKVADQLRYLCDEIRNQKKVSNTVKKYLKECFDLFDLHYKFLYESIDNKTLLMTRYALLKKIKNERFSVGEYKIISEALFLFHFNNEFYDAKRIEETIS
ncbi:MAG: hypothetical protein U9O94_00055 [Nanoarchaeota archaeon]|nr:hypothetical protein [Nanoarchaeota archaeon]